MLVYASFSVVIEKQLCIKMSGNLAIQGGPQSVRTDPGDLFTWRLLTTEDEQAY